MATPRFSAHFCSPAALAATGGERGSTATATAAIAQGHQPSRELEAQQHIVGSLETRHRAGTEHQGAQTVVGDVGPHVVDAVLHGGTAHLAAHEGAGTGTAQLLQGHALPVGGGIGHGYGQRGVFLLVIHLTHCHQV